MSKILKRCRRQSRGQSLVEFALVIPAFLLIAFGIITFAWLVFQQQSVDNASREAARDAAIISPLFENGNSTCSSGYGEPSSVQAAPANTIEQAAAGGSALVPMNSSQLCASSATATTMTSTTTQSGNATITVTGSPTLATATKVTVTVTYTAHPLSPFISSSSFVLTSSSTETVQT
jgi:hypothetical protein